MNIAQEIPAHAIEPNQRVAESISLEPPVPTKWDTLSTVLRRIGGLVLVCSALAFLLQEWAGLDSLYRYYSFLGFTLVLAGAGVFCAVKIGESKGARTFLAIAALFLPAHFAQLGALVYSRFISNHDQLFLGHSQYLRNLLIYQAPSGLLVGVTVLAASVVLFPIAFFGFSALARTQAKRLTALYAMGNALLLIPTRDPSQIAFLCLGAILVFVLADKRAFAGETAMRTKEGTIARFLIFSPLVVLLTRSIALYPSVLVVFSAGFALIAALLFVIVPSYLNDKALQAYFQGVSVIPATVSWMLFVCGTWYADLGGVYLIADAPFFIPVMYLPIAALLVLMSFAGVDSGRSYRKLAAFVAIISMLVQLFTVTGIVSSLLCVTVAIGIIAFAFIMEERGLFALGSFGLLVGLVYQLRYAVDAFNASPWFTLALVGMATILGASYLERNQHCIVEGVGEFRVKLDSWN